MTPNPLRRHAYITLPSWAWGGDPAALLAEAGVDVKRDPASGRWVVQTIENQRRQAAGLVTYKHIAGPGAYREDFGWLSSRQDRADNVPGERVQEELARREQRLRQTRNPVHALELIRLHTLVAETPALGGVVEHHFRDLLDVPLEGEPENKVFSNAGVHLIERSPALTWRLKLPMILSQITQDPLMKAGDLRHLLTEGADGEVAFRTASGLADGVYLMDAYLGPLLGALTPSVWSLAVPRTFGVLIYSLGQPMAGNSGNAEEMLHVIGVPGASRSLEVPRLTSGASHGAVKWWAQALNSMFAVLSDFAVFTNRDGEYLPQKHMQAILTMEQLFRRTASAAVADRDTNARRVLMFTALDTVERLTSIKLETMADYSYATGIVQRLRAAMWPEAAEVLLPSAERSVQALRDLGEGFFIRELLGQDDVRLLLEDGSVQSISLNRATAYYLKALRDATHGHGSKKEAARERTDALLAQHDGEVPHDLGLLSLLYLLDVLANPQRLHRVLHEWCARR